MSSRKASQVKRKGHVRELTFSNQFSADSMQEISSGVNYSGSSADCLISKPDFLYIISDLTATNGWTSVKGGNTYQFHLGKIPELIDYPTIRTTTIFSPTGKPQTRFESNINQEEQLRVLRSYAFWKKYLGKGEILSIDYAGKWHFFKMSDVLHLLIDDQKVIWRFLETGRIKGDLVFKNGKVKCGITFEHRFEKNSSVIGAHGGSTGSKTFLPWLLDNIAKVVIVDNM